VDEGKSCKPSLQRSTRTLRIAKEKGFPKPLTVAQNDEVFLHADLAGMGFCLGKDGGQSIIKQDQQDVQRAKKS